MPVNAKFLAARAAEQRNRLIAYLPGPAPVCGVMIRHLTPRAAAELSLAGNAFAASTPPLRADVFQFLWRLHPAFERPRRIAPGATLLRSVRAYGFRAGLARWRLARYVHRYSLPGAIAEIRAYLSTVYQDAPGDDDPGTRAARSLVRPPMCWVDNYTLHFLRILPGLTPETMVDVPLARLFQLDREHRLRQPDGELNVFDPSDRLLSA
jgi:hypothetical protein